MRPDHYATLEVEPSASAVEIRAAYLKLLREHHPDRNRSPEAVDRTKTIIAAFKVLGDFDQRSHYDWGRRRDREAAQAKAEAEAPRRRAKAGLAAGGIGIAALGAWLLMPHPNPDRLEAAPKLASVEPEQSQATADRTPSARPVAERPERGATAIRMRPTLPKRADSVTTLKTAPPRATKRAPPRQSEAVLAPTRVATKSAPVVRVAAKPVPPAPKPRQSSTRQPMARPATDLASLDQFVMNFYGQSWRYGDAPKRNALEQTRAGFVVRRGACFAEACKRAAYLKLMRDVSEIVESGQPKSP